MATTYRKPKKKKSLKKTWKRATNPGRTDGRFIFSVIVGEDLAKKLERRAEQLARQRGGSPNKSTAIREILQKYA